jgi:hypothetical protein
MLALSPTARGGVRPMVAGHVRSSRDSGSPPTPRLLDCAEAVRSLDFRLRDANGL